MTDDSTPDRFQPAGLADDRARLAWLRQAYYGVDGRWYLKVRDRWGADAAQDVDEDAMRSLGRLHLRVWLELTGRERVEDCTVLGRFVLDVLDTLYGSAADAVRVVRSEPDVWEMEHIRCTIFDMGNAAGFAAVPGALPGCGGIRALYSGWVAAAGPFTVQQLPSAGEPHGVACRYVFRADG